MSTAGPYQGDNPMEYGTKDGPELARAHSASPRPWPPPVIVGQMRSCRPRSDKTDRENRIFHHVSDARMMIVGHRRRISPVLTRNEVSGRKSLAICPALSSPMRWIEESSPYLTHNDGLREQRLSPQRAGLVIFCSAQVCVRKPRNPQVGPTRHARTRDGGQGQVERLRGRAAVARRG
jgi:hypothetical protein